MNIELRHLRYFVAVAEEASFTAAAHRVHVAQQALSTQIRQLEDAVGTRLLNRTNKGAALTPAGDAFLTTARETLASLDRGVAAARNVARALSGTLSVGLGSGCENETRTRLLSAFERAYPDVKVSLKTFDMTQPSAGLLDHSSDVALVRPPVAAPAIELAVVRSEPRVFVLPAGHPLTAREELRLADVAGLPFVTADLATDGCEPRAWQDDWLIKPRPGGDVPIIGATARTVDDWCEHVAAGHGIGLCPASAARFHGRPGVYFVPAAGLPPTMMCIAWRTGDTRPAVQHFVSLAAESEPQPDGTG
ncbi:MAG TPA: LysR substrate-binding domain-containing protein [Trebonia sp.]